MCWLPLHFIHTKKPTLCPCHTDFSLQGVRFDPSADSLQPSNQVVDRSGSTLNGRGAIGFVTHRPWVRSEPLAVLSTSSPLEQYSRCAANHLACLNSRWPSQRPELYVSLAAGIIWAVGIIMTSKAYLTWLGSS